MNVFRLAWRAVRQYVYSINDYASLIERDPEDMTMSEARQLQALADRSAAHYAHEATHEAHKESQRGVSHGAYL